MKKQALRAASLLLTILLLASVTFAANATEPVPYENQTNLCDVIDAALHADGFAAEDYSDRLLTLFQENPIEFLNTVKGYNKEDQDCILSMVAECAAIVKSTEFFTALDSIALENVEYQKLLTSYENAVRVIESVTDTERIEVPQYDIETITALASAYLENGETENMELFTLLGEAYQMNPELVADSLNATFNSAERKSLAAGIAKAYTTNGKMLNRSTMESIDNDFQREIEFAMAKEAQNTSIVMPRATVYTPEITSFSYSGTIEVGKATTLTIKLTEGQGTAVARTYTVKTYCTRDGAEYQVSSVSMTIPQGSTTATKSIKLTFSHAGTFTTRVEVYSGSTLLTEREGRSPDVSHGRWKIICTFPQDRTKYGVFALYNAAGELQRTGDCLGLSIKNIDENLPFGNTPCGTYTGYLTGPITGDDNPDKYGPNKCVDTTAVDVPCINNNVRNDGMWIHGGRTQTKLQPTEGCVRVFDADMLRIQKSIESMTTAANGHYKTGDVLYREN